MRTFIDVDNIVSLDCLSANKVKKYWKDNDVELLNWNTITRRIRTKRKYRII